MNRDDILWLLEGVDAGDLSKRAMDALLAAKGSHVYIRGLIEFSNMCRRNCCYCGLRARNRQAERYLLDAAAILDSAKNAVEQGADSIVLQAGEGICDPGWLAEIVREISGTLGVAVTLSVGECPEEHYRLWRRSGASRYLLKHETSDAALYAALHPGYTLASRLNCLRILGELGYEVGSGFMTGLPGQTLGSIADDILLCRDLNVSMAGVGPFIAHAQTPLAACASGDPALTLRVVSVLRLALPGANLPATTALASLDPVNGQINGLMAGANVLMPNFTPRAYAAHYRIYDNKTRVEMADAARAVEACGRSHSIRLPNLDDTKSAKS